MSLKKYSILSLALVSIILSCGDTGVTPREEPTDEDAIYNIIRYDRPSEFNTDILDLSIPDTMRLQLGPIVPTDYWYEIDHDSLFIAIDIRYVQPDDPIGTIPIANVRNTRYFWGTLEIIGVDTTGGGSTPVRMSKEFTIVVEILSKFEKYGFDYNRRRGWIVTQISDAVLNNGYLSAINSIHVTTESGLDFVVDTGRKLLADLPMLDPADSIVVVVDTGVESDFVDISFVGPNGYTTRSAISDSTGTHITGFRISDSLGYDHFLVNVTSGASLTDTTEFYSGGAGVIYRVR